MRHYPSARSWWHPNPNNWLNIHTNTFVALLVEFSTQSWSNLFVQAMRCHECLNTFSGIYLKTNDIRFPKMTMLIIFNLAGYSLSDNVFWKLLRSQIFLIALCILVYNLYITTALLASINCLNVFIAYLRTVFLWRISHVSVNTWVLNIVFSSYLFSKFLQCIHSTSLSISFTLILYFCFHIQIYL